MKMEERKTELVYEREGEDQKEERLKAHYFPLDGRK